MLRTGFFTALAVAMVAVLCSSCSPAGRAAAPSDVVVIGSLESLTGTFSSIGQGDSGGLKLITKQINAGGGFRVNGKRYTLDLVQADAASDPATTHAQAMALIRDQGARFVFGPSETPEALAAQSTTSVAGALWFSSSLGIANSLASVGPSTTLNRYSYSVGMPTKDAANTAISGLTMLEPGLKSAAILWPDDSSYDAEVSDIQAALHRAGIDVLTTIRFDPSTTDFTPLLTRLRVQAPTLIVSGASAQPTTAIEQQMVALGFGHSTLFGFGGASGNAVVTSGHPVPFPFVYPTSGGLDAHVDMPKVTNLFADYRKYNGVPAPADTPFWTLDIPGVQALVAAMQRAGTVSDAASIQKALLQVSVPTPLGAFSFKSNHLGTLRNTVCRADNGSIKCVVVPVTSPGP
jgi:branched-chain amino acid transport system substrate-binding protein